MADARQAGEEKKEGVPNIEVTPEMIEAVAAVILYRCHPAAGDAKLWARDLATLAL
jgi:hypothetical protein